MSDKNTQEPSSWRPEQKVDGAWYPNGQRFATEEEAAESALARWRGWALSENHRAVQVEGAANYVRVAGQDRLLTDEERG